MIPDAAAREAAHLPSDPAKAPHANTLPPSAQPKKGSDLLSSPHSSDSNIPPYDSNGLGVTDHAQAGAFNLAQTPSHLAKLKAKHLESGLGDEDSSLNALGERTLSWQRAAVLLFTEYIVLALLAFPYSYQIMGMAGGMITTVLVCLATLYTSHVLWRFCMAYPQCRDIADCAYYLFGEKRVAWIIAFIGLALNNLFIMGLHINAGQTAINTLGYTTCSAAWGVVMLVVMFAGSLIRNFRHTTPLGIVSAGTMFVCLLIVVIGHGVQGNPNGYVDDVKTPLTWTVWAPEGTTFVQGTAAFLNIAYTFIGQALIPTWVGDMAHPEDFPKALYLSMAAELVLFSISGAVVYSFSGTYLTTAPAYGSLIAKYGRPAAAMTLPTIIIVGIIYSLVTSRAVFFQLFDEKSIHRRSHTFKGWATWFVIVLIGWIIAFIIGEAIPFFSDLLSVIASLFDSWFGFILWACAYYKLYKREGFWITKMRSIESILNIIAFIVGCFMFGGGTYASVESIIASYANGPLKSPFSCSNGGFVFDR